jgi:hypothetical protein
MYFHPIFPLFLVMMIIVVLFYIILITTGISIFVCWLLYSCFERIPKQFHVRESWMVWLLLIPLFNLVWIFFIYPALATSYKNYFNSIGRTDVGDCGYSIALVYCICACCGVVPYIGILPGIAALVLLIVFLVKAWDLRSQIPANNPPVIEPPGPAK